jgi:hypothetical protein
MRIFDIQTWGRVVLTLIQAANDFRPFWGTDARETEVEKILDNIFVRDQEG